MDIAPTDIAVEPDIVIGGRPQLFHLLAEASEIEHTLMCTYLYAAFSLKDGSDPDLSPEELDALGRWRKTILSVALEEMVHLLLVANLTIAIGGRPHFGRPPFPVAPGHFPADVVVRLAPFDRETFVLFRFLEWPRGVVLSDAEAFRCEKTYERAQAYHGLSPSIQDYGTVGHLYAAVRKNLVEAARRLGEGALFIGPVASQVGRGAVQLKGVDTIFDLASALRAVDLIVEQGEGSSADREDSHYQRFVAIRAEHEAVVEKNPQFVAARPAAVNPVMRQPPDPGDKVFVDAPGAARVLDFGNAVYALVLQLIVQAFHRPEVDADAAQSRLFDIAIELMHILSRTGTALTRMPASESNPEIHAGLSFTPQRAVEAFFVPIEEALLAERLAELAGGARVAMRAAPQLEGVDATIERLAGRFQKP